MNKKTLIITWDGCRPDGLAQADTPWLDSQKSMGIFSDTGRTTMPSGTQPCHASLFYGADPSLHHVTDNFDYPKAPDGYKTLFDMARESGLHTGAYVGWVGVLYTYGHPYSTVSSRFSSIQWDGNPAKDDSIENYLNGAIRYLNEEKPDLAHIYFELPDMAGHRYGWMSPEYITIINYTDDMTKRLLEGADDDYSIFIFTDHGGHNFIHGTDCDEDMNIWFFAMGEGIQENKTLGAFNIMDIGATVVDYLGFKNDPRAHGKILDIFK